MRNILLRIFVNTAALWLVEKLFTDIYFQDTNALIITAIVFGLLNTFIKPVLVVFTLPINILSLGLFTVIINAAILKLTDFWIDSFSVTGFWTAVLGAIVISIVSVVLNSILKD